MPLMKISSVSERNEWKLVQPLGKAPTKRRRQVCLVVGDKVFVFGGTSPSTVPDPPEIQDIIDDDHQGLEVKLMDHSDLHILDFGMFLHSFYLVLLLAVSCACQCNSLIPSKYILDHSHTCIFCIIGSMNVVVIGTLR